MFLENLNPSNLLFFQTVSYDWQTMTNYWTIIYEFIVELCRTST